MIVYCTCLLIFNKANQHEEYFFERLHNLTRYYTWDLNTNSEANISWDRMQKLECCGIKQPDDWNEHRPACFPADSYPSSCCSAKSRKFVSHENNDYDFSYFCRKPDAWQVGCKKQVKDIRFISLLYWASLLIAHTILAKIAKKPKQSDPHSATEDSNSGGLILAMGTINSVHSLT